MNIKTGIIGAAGYTGGEMIRLLINHPNAKILFAHSNSNEGKFVHQVHGDLAGETNLKFSRPDGHWENVDLVFLCVGHGEARKFMDENELPAKTKVIDLSQDFRLLENATHGQRNFVYGLPELNKKAIQSASNIANPGCFATAIQLGLLPLAKQGSLREVFTTGITGSTGAGQSFSATSHFSWRENNIQAYKTLTHQHLAEIDQSMRQLQEEHLVDIHFVPWRGDFTRGIFASSTLNTSLGLPELYSLFRDFYKDHPFITVSEEPIHLKQVVNTNKAFLQLEKSENMLVVHSAIDNLLKGASGQAIQNMNLLFGIEETAGLKLKANYF